MTSKDSHSPHINTTDEHIPNISDKKESMNISIYRLLTQNYIEKSDELLSLDKPTDDIRHKFIISLNELLQFEFYRCLLKDENYCINHLYQDFKEKYTEDAIEDCICSIYIKLYDIYINFNKYTCKQFNRITAGILLALRNINFEVEPIYIAMIYSYISSIYINIYVTNIDSSKYSNTFYLDKATMFYKKCILCFNKIDLTNYEKNQPTFYRECYLPIFQISKLGLYKAWYYSQTKDIVPLENGYTKFISSEHNIIIRLISLNNLIWLSFTRSDINHDSLVLYFTQLCEISSKFKCEIYNLRLIMNFIIKESLFIIAAYMKNFDYCKQLDLFEKIFLHINIVPPKDSDFSAENDTCYPSNMVKAAMLQELSPSYDLSRFIATLLYANILYVNKDSEFDYYMDLLIKFIDECNFKNPLENYIPFHLIYILDFEIYKFLTYYHSKKLLSNRIKSILSFINGVNSRITSVNIYIASITAKFAASHANKLVESTFHQIKLLAIKNKKDKQKLKKCNKKQKKASKKKQLAKINATNIAYRAAFDANFAVQKALDVIDKVKNQQKLYIVNSILYEIIIPAAINTIDKSQLCICCFNPATILYCSHKILCDQCNKNKHISNETCIICNH